jgi:hypothetical protein
MNLTEERLAATFAANQRQKVAKSEQLDLLG